MQVNKILLTRDCPEQFSSFFVRSFQWNQTTIRWSRASNASAHYLNFFIFLSETTPYQNNFCENILRFEPKTIFLEFFKNVQICRHFGTPFVLVFSQSMTFTWRTLRNTWPYRQENIKNSDRFFFFRKTFFLPRHCDSILTCNWCFLCTAGEGKVMRVP